MASADGGPGEMDTLDWAVLILRLGHEGMSRAEIAAEIGLTLARLKAWEASDADVGKALAMADTAAQAWWEGQQREALLDGRRVNAAAWRAAMEWRFGDGKARAKAANAPPLARYEIPDNGKERKPRQMRRR